MSIKLCAHVKHDGSPCQAIPLHDSPYCYFHRSYYKAAALPGDPKYQVPLLESHHSVQLAVTDLYQSFLTGKIGLKEARFALQLLRLASKTIIEIERTKANESASVPSSSVGSRVAKEGASKVKWTPSVGLNGEVAGASNPFVNPKPPQPAHKGDRYVDPCGCLAPMIGKEESSK